MTNPTQETDMAYRNFQPPLEADVIAAFDLLASLPADQRRTIARRLDPPGPTVDRHAPPVPMSVEDERDLLDASIAALGDRQWEIRRRLDELAARFPELRRKDA